MRNGVVLPAPFDPMNPNKSPRFTVRFKLLNATIEPYMRVRSVVCTAGTVGETSIAIKLTFLHRHNQAQHRIPPHTDRLELVDRFGKNISLIPGEHHRVAALHFGG